MDAADRHAIHHTPPPHRHGRRGRQPPRAEQLHRHVHALDLEAPGHRLLRLPGGQRLARQGVRPAGPPALGRLHRQHRALGRAQGRLRLRASGTAAPSASPTPSSAAASPRCRSTSTTTTRATPGPYPIPPDAPIEGGPDSDGDRHVLVVDRDACRLYETLRRAPERRRLVVSRLGRGLRPALERGCGPPAGPPPTPPACRSSPGSSATTRWRPGRSTTPSGSPCPTPQKAYLWPARHQAGSSTDPDLPPDGPAPAAEGGLRHLRLPPPGPDRPPGR